MAHRILTSTTIDGSLSTGEYGTSTGHILLDTTPTNVPVQVGAISWNDAERCVDIQENGTTLQVGQEQRFPLVKAATTIRDGMVVYASSQVGGSSNIIVSPFEASANGPDELYMLGIATEAMAANDFGFVTTFGKVNGINGSSYTSGGIKDPNDTASWAFGMVLYASPNTTYPGCLTSVKPTSPDKIMPLAMVVFAPNQTNINIIVRAEHGYHLGELHDVRDSAVADRDILSYDSTDSVWKYQSPSELNLVSGNGTTNYVPKWTPDGNTLGNSNLSDNGTLVSSSTDMSINGVRVGLGGGSVSTNTVVGKDAMSSITTGNYNVAIGRDSLQSNLSSNNNVAIGYEAAKSSVSASNVAIGYQALKTSNIGGANVAIGDSAMSLADGASYSIAIGLNSLQNVQNTTNNIAIGYNALRANVNMGNNVVIGNFAMNDNNNTFAAGYNIAIGTHAGRYQADGVTGATQIGTSVFIGDTTKALSNNQYNQIVIGYNATGLGSNSVVLGNDSITKTALKGNVLIGTTTDNGYKLNVNGSAVVNQFKYTKATYVAGDLNNVTDAGFYEVNSITNGPTTGYYYVTVERYSGDTQWVKQTATSFGSGNTGNITYIRTKQAGTWGAWAKVWADNTDGSSSGLDADLLDGQHGSYYASASSVTTASDNLKLYVQSRLENLVTNGSGLLGTNENFASATFITSDLFSGGGSFAYTTNGAFTATSTEYIPVDVSKQHRFDYYIKVLQKFTPSDTPRHYGMTIAYDIDKNSIQPYHVMKYNGSKYTTLAVDLVNGATTITVTDATGWYTGTTAHQRTIGFFDYVNGSGYTYPPYTYTRNIIYNGTTGAWASGGISGNVITLVTPYSGPTRLAGTPVANMQSGGGYDYIAGANSLTPEEWGLFSGTQGPSDGVMYTIPSEGDIVSNNGTYSSYNGFRWGTAFTKIGWLINYSGTTGSTTTAVSSISFAINLLKSSATDNYIPRLNGTNLLENSQIYDNGTNVGIGTSSPSAPLTFGKTVYAEPTSEDFFRIKIQDAGGTNNDVGIGQSANGCFDINYMAGQNFKLYAGTSGEALRVTGNKNLLIGTTTDNGIDKLQVNGTGYFSGIVTGNAFRTNTASTDYNLLTRNTGFASPVLYVNNVVNNASSYIARFAYGSATPLSGDTPVLTINGGSSYFQNCNVGIGTTNPQKKLTLGLSASVSNQGVSLSDTSGAIEYARFGVVNPTVSNDSYIGAIGNNNFSIYSNNTERVRVSNTGNVGIGTTSPNSPIEIVNNGTGEALRISRSGAPSQYISINESNNTEHRIQAFGDKPIRIKNNSTSNGIEFYVGTTGTINALNITSAGNVLIGTTTDNGYKLQVNGDATINGVRVGLGGGSVSSNTAVGNNALYSNISGTSNTAIGRYALRVATNSYNTSIGDGSSYTLSGGSRNTAIGVNALHLATSDIQNVAIGMNSLYNLNLSSGRNVAIGYEAGINYTGEVALTTASYSVFIGTSAKANANSQTNQIVIGADATGIGSNSVTLGNDSITKTALKGNVGIGTTNPYQKLHVNGGVLANSFALRESAIDDYGPVIWEDGSNNAVFGTDGYYANVDIYSNNTRAIRINGSGNVLINTTTDNTLGKLQVNGSGYFNGTLRATGDVIAYYSSDERLKDNKVLISNPIEKVKAIGGYEFDWNDKQDTYSGHDYGVIAQEIEEILPELVITRDNGYKAVKYEKIVPLLIESIKEQQNQIEELKELVNKLINK